MKILSLLVAVCCVSWTAGAQVKLDPVEYKQGDTILEGYIAYDAGVKEPRPGVVIVHDWMGVGDYVKMRAEQLVKLGYVAFVADIYGKGVHPKDAQEASQLAGKYRGDRALLRARADAAVKELKKHNVVDVNRIGAMGYCFGGGTVLELARSGEDLAGVVSFHGNLDTPNPDDGKNIKCKVLVLHGADDPFVQAKDVQAFQEEMRKAGVDWQFVAFGGAVHAFTQKGAGNDPGKGAAYNARADARSFEEMVRFWKEAFGPPDVSGHP
jgi:dienelactone hydrolase